MALPTLADYETMRALCDAAIVAEDWALATKYVARLNLLISGLPTSTLSDTQSVTMRQDLKAVADLILVARSTKVDNRRFIKAGVRHQTGGGMAKRPPPRHGDRP